MKDRLKTYLLSATVLSVLLCTLSCSDDAQPSQNPLDAPIAILETDIGSSCDDLLAMDILYSADAQGLIDLKAIMVNREGLENLRTIDIMNTYYGQPEVLIGNVHDGPQNSTIFTDYWKMAVPEKFPEEPHFKRTLDDEQLRELPYAENLYRKILSEAPDASVVIFSVGFATNLSHLLQTSADEYSPMNGVELVKKKVKALYIQAGHFGQGELPDYNFTEDPANAKILMEKWPTEIWFSPQETGDKFDYKTEVLLADFAAAGMTDSPIYHVYEHHPCTPDQRMWDACAILQFVHPECFSIAGPTHYEIDDEMILHETPGQLHYMTYTETEEQYNLVMKFIRQRHAPKK